MQDKRNKTRKLININLRLKELIVITYNEKNMIKTRRKRGAEIAKRRRSRDNESPIPARRLVIQRRTRNTNLIGS